MTTRETSRLQVDQAIGAYRADKTPAGLALALRSLRTFFGAFDPPDSDAPDEEGDHFILCRRLCGALEPVGFKEGTPEADELLDAAADELYQSMTESQFSSEPYPSGVLGQGRDSSLEGGGFLAVDLVKQQVLYHPTEPVVAEWSQPIRREAPKVGRNDPCPCGSSKKFKRCCLGVSA